MPTRRFAHVHVDIVGPLPPTATGVRHVLTVINRTTRWVEVILLPSTTATACAEAMVSGWIARFGVPETITSDKGAQFTSDVRKVLCSSLGVAHVTTTSYHPQSNGLVKRFH